MTPAHTLLVWVLRATWGGSVVVLLVLLIQHLLGRRMSARWRYNLLLLAAVRLALPAVPGAKFSPFNWLRWDRPQLAAAPSRPQPAAPPVLQSKREPARVPRRLVQHPPVVVARSDDGQRFLIEIETPQPVEATAISADDAAAPQAAQTFGPPPQQRAAPRPAAQPTPTTAMNASTSEPAPVAARALVIDWWGVAAVAWVIGAAAMLARVAWSSMWLAVVVRRLRAVDDPQVTELAEDCCRLLRVRRVPQLLEGPPGSCPTLVGVLRPRLVLPPCVIREFAWREQRLILLHELIHLKRLDVAANYLLALVQAIHWFNPLAWVLVRRIRAEREIACDEAVLTRTPWREGRAYGAAMLKLLEILSRGPWPAGGQRAHVPLAVGVLQHKALVYRRIAMIARFDGKRQPWSISATLLSLAVAATALTGAVRTEACDPPQDQTAAKQSTVTEIPAAQEKPAAEDNADDAKPEKPDQAEEKRDADDAKQEANDAKEEAPSGPSANEPATPAEPKEADAAPAAEPAEPMPPQEAPPATVEPPPQPDEAVAALPPAPAVQVQPGLVGRIEGRAGAEADARALEKLQQEAPADFDKTPLKEALYKLVDAVGVGLYIDEDALSNAGVHLDAPVNMHIREGVPVEQSMEWALKSAGKGALGFAIERGVVVVSSREELARYLVTRVYDVRGIDLDGRDDSLPSLIVQTVQPDAWNENGGSSGVIRMLGPKLVVTTNEPIQREIGRLLEVLRDNPPTEARAKQGPRPGPVERGGDRNPSGDAK